MARDIRIPRVGRPLLCAALLGVAACSPAPQKKEPVSLELDAGSDSPVGDAGSSVDAASPPGADAGVPDPVISDGGFHADASVTLDAGSNSVDAATVMPPPVTDVDAGTMPEPCVSEDLFFAQRIWSGFMGKACTQCHLPEGLAPLEYGSSLTLEPSTTPGFLQTNLEALRRSAEVEVNGVSQLLLKPFGDLGHVGGAVLPRGGPEEAALQELVGRLQSPSSCDAPAPTDILGELTLMDAASTLRKASLQLLGQLPSAEQLQQARAGGEGALDGLLDTVLANPALSERIKEIFNDVLFTDVFLQFKGRAVHEFRGSVYAGITPYGEPAYPEFTDPSKILVNTALAQEPLELIAYIVRNNRSFKEVLTADYTVVNPYSARAYLLDVPFQDPLDPTEFVMARVRMSSPSIPVPHAGVLSTPAYLNRFVTTPTNRNRHRARMVYKQFLGMDVLSISERPVDAAAAAATENGTRTQQACVTCHRMLDPVAVGFRGYHESNYEQFDPNAVWYPQMWPGGFGSVAMPAMGASESLPWLARRVADDPRFATTMVRTMLHALTGTAPLAFPADASAADFADRLRAFEVQSAFIQDVARDFSTGGYNLKTIIKRVLKSPYFRAIGVRPGASLSPALLSGLGTSRFLTPEMLNRKILATMGFKWRKNWPGVHDFGGEWLLEDYRILFGGMDSESITTRITEPNSVMWRVAERIAHELACKGTAWDFTHPASQRRLFPLVEPSTAPQSGGVDDPDAIHAIKRNIQHLHERLLGEPLALDSPELQHTWQLFLDAWRDARASGSGELQWECQGRWDARTAQDLPSTQWITRDDHFTIRAWLAVMVYLLTDHRFLVEE